MRYDDSGVCKMLSHEIDQTTKKSEIATEPSFLYYVACETCFTTQHVLSDRWVLFHDVMSGRAEILDVFAQDTLLFAVAAI